MNSKLLLGLLLLGLQNFQSTRAQPANNYKIIAYYTGNGEAIRQFQVDKLTHIIYSFAALHTDTLALRDSQQVKTVQQLVALKKQYPRLKIMISMGGWGGCGPCSELFASAAHRETFARTTAALLKEYDLDGIDLDWEYPAIAGYPGHRYDSSDKNNFTALLKSIRKNIGNTRILSFAAGGFENYIDESVDWKAVMPLIDFVNLMTYDLVGGYSTVTGHHTPLFDYQNGQESVNKCVNALMKKKVPPSKLIVGGAFYARVWEQVPDSNHGLYQPGHFKEGVAFRDFDAYFADSAGFRYYWDERAKAGYAYNSSRQLFATFDDTASLRQKAEYVRRKKLGGIMFWELSEDLFSGGLVEAIARVLRP